MGTLIDRIREELVKLLPPTLFFFVVLHILAFARALMSRGEGIEVTTSVAVTVAALILGKAVLIADMLPFINRFPEKPLVWNVAWKTAIYLLLSAVIHYFERLYDFWKETPGFMAANARMLEELVWPEFWAVQILLVLIISSYCVIAELGRIMGPQRLRRMFFGPLEFEHS